MTTSAPDADSETVFTTTSDVDVTRVDLYKRLVSEYVVTPFTIIWDDWRTRIGLTIFTGYLVMGLFALTIFPRHSLNQAPVYIPWFSDLHYPLGTNQFGIGLWNQIAHSTLPMLEMIFAGALFSTSIAVMVGTFSGYKGGNIDTVLMTITDIVMTMPGLPLVILVVALFKPSSPAVIGILLSVNAWAGLARTIRSQVLSLRRENYVEASRVTGMSTRFILSKDIIPPLMPYISINFMNAARGVIFGAVGLYFIGVLPYTRANWGVLLNQAYSELSILSPEGMFRAAIPLLTILFFSVSLVLLAQGLDQVFNPRIRARHQDEEPGEEGPEGTREVMKNPGTSGY